MSQTDAGQATQSVAQEAPAQASRPTKIDLPPSQAPVDENEQPPTPHYTYVEDDQGRLQPLYEGAGPGYEPEPRFKKEARSDGKVELTSRMAPRAVGLGWPSWKKWSILSVVFMVQVSMNFNTSVYPNAVALIPEDPRFKGVSEQGARVGQMIFLVAYAFGSEVCNIWFFTIRILTQLQ